MFFFTSQTLVLIFGFFVRKCLITHRRQHLCKCLGGEALLGEDRGRERVEEQDKEEPNDTDDQQDRQGKQEEVEEGAAITIELEDTLELSTNF